MNSVASNGMDPFSVNTKNAFSTKAARPGSLGWFARHELSLSLRDFMAMMSAGKKGRERVVTMVLIGFVAILHLVAYAILNPIVADGGLVTKAAYLGIASSIALMACMMISQAMESVTRAFYTRSDLDLILSSPIMASKLFTVRILAIVTSTSLLSLGLASPALNVLAVLDHPAWLSGYLLIPALGAISTALALSITVGLFKTLGAKRTRLVAQIIAAVVGAGFIIGIQLAAIASLGSVSRFELISSDAVQAVAPSLDSWWWVPVKAITGAPLSLLICLGFAVSVIAFSIRSHAASFADHVIAAAGVSGSRQVQKVSKVTFAKRSTRATLRAKEWRLLLRDKWLLSQTLMQVLYLIPPAFMLWQSYGTSGAASVVIIPILVMASGQLAGGLAWLAISGEDAPQLVQTAPVSGDAIILAKVEAVLGALIIITLPFIAVLAVQNVQIAITAAGGIAIATIASTLIQLWFRSQAKRSNFRRRQTSSRIATLCEAFSSIMWAGTAGLMAVGSLAALATAGLAVLVLFVAWLFKPASVEGA